MALLRSDRKAFENLIATASNQLKIPEILIEKDYWLTQVLRALNQKHFGEFILKGGTSLSKGYQLIDRFSEDVDLLLIPQAADHDTQAVGTLLRSIEGTIEGITGNETYRESAEEGVATITIAPYPGVVATYGSEDRAEIRVDHGVPGGPIPSESRDLHTQLTTVVEQAGNDLSKYEDLEPCRVMMLHPARTLVEKFCVVAGIGERIRGGNTNVRSREPRHYYDIWFLLDEERSPALNWLRQEGGAEALLEDCVRITERFYDTSVERPSSGFSTCAAFDDDTIDVVRKSYSKMIKKFAYPGRESPSLDDVVDRVRSHATDL